MKRKKASFTGMRPIFTGSPSIVMGGFNLDVVGQRFRVGDTIPAGTPAIRDEEKRLVQVIKTARVVEVDAEDAKLVTLYVDEFYAPCFAEGEIVGIDGGAPVAVASAPTISRIEENGSVYRITLSSAITGLKAGDVLVELVSDGNATTPKTKQRGQANSVTIKDVDVSEFETAVDVCADTMQYALYERRVAPIPASQKDTTGCYLAANPHVKLTKSL